VYFAVSQKLNAQKMVRELERSTVANTAGDRVCNVYKFAKMQTKMQTKGRGTQVITNKLN
jgi:hypothetical protein